MFVLGVTCCMVLCSGGTPNLSQYTRAIPHPGLWCLPPENPTRNHSLPYDTWEKMTPAGKHACRYLVCDPGEVIPKNDWSPNCEKQHIIWRIV